ncbi:MAG: Cysteine--tRNA ligase [candidate division TA06 bacterium ADurb.Bin417]|uniref:Cysteine--tRNA ligase n=1 Tax=candidate division TA06 bacterium ADurb.Bin417 TaxID=1852828 RepID=A0A1V5MCR6_UNCT6|nr:MAG: Cysteine--tRNA ligase [candidate division TA06 bacterium ADurb.Bin417]
MTLRFQNTESRTKQEFTPLEPGKVSLYTCGPTVYNFAHIGNFRAYVFEDLLRRYLEYRGYAVTHIMNLTDVEDKLIRTCRETGEALKSVTARYAAAFFEDVKALGILPAHRYPAATDHIPEMVEMIKILRDKGHTYEDKGSIYFKLGTFPRYGRLSHMDLDQLRTGASGRVDADEYEAEEARDFALWKAWDENDGEVYWETELGKGRPGWHIECSAMSTKYLGPRLDIHCGGVDNIFPHHENEIAQSEAATGRPFARYFLHCAHLMVEGEKMSKSKGNFYTLRDLLARGHDPVAVRALLLAVHYRSPLNFTFDGLAAAGRSVERIQGFYRRLDSGPAGPGAGAAGRLEAAGQEFRAALDDDLNISAALAAVHNLVSALNPELEAGRLSADERAAVRRGLKDFDQVLALLPADSGPELTAAESALVAERQAARGRRDFARADQLRDELLRLGIVVEDTPAGPRIVRRERPSGS